MAAIAGFGFVNTEVDLLATAEKHSSLNIDAKAIADYEPQGSMVHQQGMLKLSKGDMLKVIEIHKSGWYGGHKIGCEETGWFPGAYVQVLDTGESNDGMSSPETECNGCGRAPAGVEAFGFPVERDQRAVATPMMAERRNSGGDYQRLLEENLQLKRQLEEQRLGFEEQKQLYEHRIQALQAQIREGSIPTQPAPTSSAMVSSYNFVTTTQQTVCSAAEDVSPSSVMTTIVPSLPRTPLTSSRETVQAAPPRSGSTTPVCGGSLLVCNGSSRASTPQIVAAAAVPPSPRHRPWAYPSAAAAASCPPPSSKWQQHHHQQKPQPASPNGGRRAVSPAVGVGSGRVYGEEELPRNGVRRLVSAFEQNGDAASSSSTSSGLFRFASTGTRHGDSVPRSQSSYGRVCSSRSAAVTAVPVASAAPPGRCRGAVSASPSVLHRSTSNKAGSYIPIAAAARVQAPAHGASPLIGSARISPSVPVRERIQQFDYASVAHW